MGACEFSVRAKGRSAREAFQNAVDEALYESGHGGYTGSIAEKRSFIEIPLPQGEKAGDYAYKLIDSCDPRVDDKWGPAGCIKISEGEYLFFGWASS